MGEGCGESQYCAHDQGSQSTRRGFLQKLLGGGVVLSSAGVAGMDADSAANRTAMEKNGVMPEESVYRAPDWLMEQVEDGEQIDLHHVFVQFGEADTPYDADRFCDMVEMSLEELEGVDVSAYWTDINVTPESYAEAADVDMDTAADAVETYRDVITGTGIGFDGDVNAVYTAIEELSEQYGVAEDIEEGDMTGYLANFTGEDGVNRVYENVRGVSGRTRPGGVSLVSLLPSTAAAANMMVHEHAHHFGLEHTYTSVDPMSYAPSRVAKGAVSRISFSDESHENWEAERERYRAQH